VHRFEREAGKRAQYGGFVSHETGLEAVTKKTYEAAGFSLGFPSALMVITGSSAAPKWVKTRKTRGFLGSRLEGGLLISVFPGGNETPGFHRFLSGFVSIPPPKEGDPQEIVLRINPDHS